MNTFDLLNIMKVREEQAAEVLRAWESCIDAITRLSGGSIKKAVLLERLASMRDDKADQGYFEAANVYQGVINLVSVI